MSKKGSLLTLVAGVAAGAAALFFSKKANREMAKKEIQKASTKVKQAKKEVKKAVTKVKAQTKKVASKAPKAAPKKAVKKSKAKKSK
ncbi:MAG TPA: hypothetical protein VD999_06455 [Vitreimonas sp.]|nr:hypothetical protein [Vitreimonas sp.]